MWPKIQTYRFGAGHNVTVNEERYIEMLDGWFFPNVATHDLENHWFQQDGAIPHTSNASIEKVREMFDGRILSKKGNVDWPPRSCDLTPLDFFLWGHVKALVYEDKPTTLDHLESNIERVIGEIQPIVLERVTKNWTDRLAYVKRSRGGHMPEIIFKY